MVEMGFWNIKENCLNECKKYETISELQKECYGCYMGLKRNGWLEEAYPNKKEVKPMGWWNNKEHCMEECKNHNSLTRLKKDCHGCYISIKKHHWEDDMTFRDKKHEKPKIIGQVPFGYWNNKENCFKEAKRYSTVYEVQRYNYGCYMGLKRNGWVCEAFPPKEGIKPMNYWNDKERVLKAASQCTTKMEFKRKFGGAFNSALRNGWENEAFSAFTKTIKYIDLNKKVHCVYVYEIENLKSCYVGRTSNLHNRDLSHRRGRKHHDGSMTYDTLYTFCHEHEIEIPTPIIKDEGLNGEESLIMEDYWVNWYKDNGWNVLNAAKTGRLSGSLGAIKKWDYESCKKFCKDYVYKYELKKASYSCYDTCLKNGWFNEFGIYDKNNIPIDFWNNKENCLREAKKYKSIKRFKMHSFGAYKGAERNGWLNEINEIINNNTIDPLVLCKQ